MFIRLQSSNNGFSLLKQKPSQEWGSISISKMLIMFQECWGSKSQRHQLTCRQHANQHNLHSTFFPYYQTLPLILTENDVFISFILKKQVFHLVSSLRVYGIWPKIKIIIIIKLHKTQHKRTISYVVIINACTLILLLLTFMIDSCLSRLLFNWTESRFCGLLSLFFLTINKVVKYSQSSA